MSEAAKPARKPKPAEEKAPAKPIWGQASAEAFFEAAGHIARLLSQSVKTLTSKPLEMGEVLRQMEAIGVKSTGLVLITSLFIGMVMALQFAIGLQKFGGMEYTGRVVALSFSRELAPTLTAVIVGGRIGAGIAAELGSMAVTEQIDAIRALGADPVKKLVMPRLVAATLVMPLLSQFSLFVGFAGAMLITSAQFGLPAAFFLNTGLDSVTYPDFWNGFLKTPFFGATIALVGCHFGITTRGGTEGVGRATTKAVEAVAVSILVLDYVLTTLFAWLVPR